MNGSFASIIFTLCEQGRKNQNSDITICEIMTDDTKKNVRYFTIVLKVLSQFIRLTHYVLALGSAYQKCLLII